MDSWEKQLNDLKVALKIEDIEPNEEDDAALREKIVKWLEEENKPTPRPETLVELVYTRIRDKRDYVPYANFEVIDDYEDYIDYIPTDEELTEVCEEVSSRIEMCLFLEFAWSQNGHDLEFYWTGP